MKTYIYDELIDEFNKWKSRAFEEADFEDYHLLSSVIKEIKKKQKESLTKLNLSKFNKFFSLSEREQKNKLDDLLSWLNTVQLFQYDLFSDGQNAEILKEILIALREGRLVDVSYLEDDLK